MGLRGSVGIVVSVDLLGVSDGGGRRILPRLRAAPALRWPRVALAAASSVFAASASRVVVEGMYVDLPSRFISSTRKGENCAARLRRAEPFSIIKINISGAAILQA